MAGSFGINTPDQEPAGNDANPIVVRNAVGSTGPGASQTSPSYVSESAASIATSQQTLSTTVALACAARAGRRSATITNTTTTAVWLGPAGVTPTTGTLLPGVVGASVTINTSAAIYGVTGAGTATVSALETF